MFLGVLMSYVSINGRKFALVEYLTEDQINWLIENKIIPEKPKMRIEEANGVIRIKTAYIGKFKTNERTEDASQVYFCESNQGFYLSLDHGYPKPGVYGVYRKAKKGIFGNREEYMEGYKDVPGLDENIDHFIKSDESQYDADLWELYYDKTSL